MLASVIACVARRMVLVQTFVVFAMVCAFPHQSAYPEQGDSALASILRYIRADWDQLTRSMTRCDSVVDPKLSEPAVLYLPTGFREPDSVKKLAASCNVRVQHLPVKIEHPGQANLETIKPHGLLFLPNPYVVPGGRFNEMYGWDSYFIILGLVQDGRLELARGMMENFLFEIEHYGTVLNANRTYYLTRSQPPFLTSMILSVYDAEKAVGRADRKWLERAYRLAAQDYAMWTKVPHLAGATGLSRYYDFGTGPTPETSQDEVGLRRKVVGYFLLHPQLGKRYLAVSNTAKRAAEAVSPAYGVQVCDTQNTPGNPVCNSAGDVTLSAEYYKGDRSMRESGFDISFRFGPYGAGTHHFAPICLNSLLYKAEKDLAKMAHELDRPADTKEWEGRATQRKQLIDRYLWDAKRGLFFDYDFEAGTRSTYEYVTTLYPLWAGLATSEQAQAVWRNLKIFEQPGGLATSSVHSGDQWDYPYGWAPLQLLAVEGLRHYGNNSDADRIAAKFLSIVLKNFRREGTIREKYNVVTGSSDAVVVAGYQTNVTGFGWTNGVFLQLLHELPEKTVERLENP
jgi:alpha,alpha-trehalase